MQHERNCIWVPWRACNSVQSLCAPIVALAWEVSRSAKAMRYAVSGRLHLFVDHFISQSNKNKQESRRRQLGFGLTIRLSQL